MESKLVPEGLREMRQTTGLTLQQAAESLSTTEGELSRYERAERRMPLRLVGPMAVLYHTTVSQVLAANERDWLRREETVPAPRPRRPKKQVGA